MGESDVKQAEIRVKGTPDEVTPSIMRWVAEVKRREAGSVEIRTAGNTQSLVLRPFASQHERIEVTIIPAPDGASILGEGAAKDWAALADLWEELRAELEPWTVDGETKPKPTPETKRHPRQELGYDWAFVEIEYFGKPPRDVFDAYWLEFCVAMGSDDSNTAEKPRKRRAFDQAMSARRKKYKMSG